jgi:hypothetical protein
MKVEIENKRYLLKKLKEELGEWWNWKIK